MSPKESGHVFSDATIRSAAFWVCVLVVGALLGSFLGTYIGMTFSPEHKMNVLFAKEITAGLNPTILNLKVLEITFGCIFKFNITSVLGIIVSAFLFKTLVK